jgi:hypothetical protein
MFVISGDRILILGVIFAFVATSASAQQEVYKWVDKDGVTHFSGTPPTESELANTEGSVDSKIFAPSVPAAPATQPIARMAAAPDTDEAQVIQPEIAAQPAVEAVDITQMSLEDLDRRCDVAREKHIAPLRAAEIASCKEQKRNDPDWCERFNADYGDGGRTVSGSVRPRMFDDLPECIDHLSESNRRGR